MNPLKIKVDTAGEQNIYFVFKNPKAEGKRLFAVNTIEFVD